MFWVVLLRAYKQYRKWGNLIFVLWTQPRTKCFYSFLTHYQLFCLFGAKSETKFWFSITGLPPSCRSHKWHFKQNSMIWKSIFEFILIKYIKSSELALVLLPEDRIHIFKKFKAQYNPTEICISCSILVPTHAQSCRTKLPSWLRGTTATSPTRKNACNIRDSFVIPLPSRKALDHTPIHLHIFFLTTQSSQK